MTQPWASAATASTNGNIDTSAALSLGTTARTSTASGASAQSTVLMWMLWLLRLLLQRLRVTLLMLLQKCCFQVRASLLQGQHLPVTCNHLRLQLVFDEREALALALSATFCLLHARPHEVEDLGFFCSQLQVFLQQRWWRLV